MAHLLRFGQSGRSVDFATPITAPTSSFSLEYTVAITNTAAWQSVFFNNESLSTNTAGSFGSQRDNANNKVNVWFTLDGKARVIYVSPTNFTFGAPFTIRIEWSAATSQIRIFQDGTLLTTYNGYSTFNIAPINGISRNSFQGDLYAFKIIRDGVTYDWNTSASNGQGTSLIDTASGNNGTIVGGATYVYYNSITSSGIPNNTLGAALNTACAINLNNYFPGATSYSVLSGSLPTGLSISGNQIVGTPTTAQSTTLVIRASNSIDTLDSATITFNTGLWYLNNATGADSRISIPSVTIGATVGDYIEIKAIANAGNPNGQYRLLGQNNSTFTNGIELTTAGIIFMAGGTRTDFTTGWTLPAVGIEFTVRFVRTSATTWEAFRNGVLLGSVTNTNSLTAITVIGSTWTGEAFRGGIYYVAISTNGGASATRYYDPNTSGGVGNLLIDRVSNQNGTQAGTWPANDSEWVSYAPAGGDSFAGTIGKTSLSILTKSLSTQLGLVIGGGKSSNTLSNKTLDVSSGYSSTVDKSTSTISQKQFSVSVGTVLGVGKQTLVLSNKQESTQLGYVNTLSKLGYTLATKQLSVVVGANLPFTGVLNKTTYSLSGKQLAINTGLNLSVVKNSNIVSTKQFNTVLGWNSGLNIQSLNVDGKQESANLGYVVDINELSIPVIGKPFSIQTGTSISFVGELSKSDLNLVGNNLSVDAGTVIPFIGLLGKTSLSLSGKALSRLHGQILDIQKQSVSLITKQLSVGEVVYPIIPVERLFTFTDKGRTYLFKQTTNVYLLTNKNNTYLIKGK